MKKKLFFWAPLLSHIGTIDAVLNSSRSLNKFGKYDIYVLDHFGVFKNHLALEDDIKILNIFNISNKLPSTGIFSKILIYLISFLSIPHLFYYMKKYKPDIFIINLVGTIPLALKSLLSGNCIFINSIQGYPKFNFLRTFLWRVFYKKSNLIITMTNLSKEKIASSINLDVNKIVKVNNPVIYRKIKLLSKEYIEEEYQEIFSKYFSIVAIGRLTRQKNFIALLRVINRINLKVVNKNFFLFIIGTGELKNELQNYIEKNNIKNIRLLGFKKNPYKYLAKAKLFISSSLWEDPGHALIEACYLNIPVLTSNCPSGPKENFIHNYNSYVYNMNDENDLFKKLNKIVQNEELSKKSILINAKKLSKQYTFFNYYKTITKYL